jgi:hypothetical protein
VQNKKHASFSHHRYAFNIGLPCAVVLTVSFALSPVIGFFVTVAGVDSASINANLTPASRRQDHTTSPSASDGIRRLPPFASTASRAQHP